MDHFVVSILLLLQSAGFFIGRSIELSTDLAPSRPKFPGSHEKTSAGNPVMKPHRYARFLMALSLLALTAVFLHARGQEIQPAREPLSSFPKSLGTRSGIDTPFLRTFRSTGDGDSLWRLYRPNGAPDVDLFVAYFASQRAGDTLHSPKTACRAMAGSDSIWRARNQRSRVAPFRANEYLVAKNSRDGGALLVQSHNRAVAMSLAKFYQVADAIRYNRSDGSLIRITTLSLTRTH